MFFCRAQSNNEADYFQDTIGERCTVDKNCNDRNKLDNKLLRVAIKQAISTAVHGGIGKDANEKGAGCYCCVAGCSSDACWPPLYVCGPLGICFEI